MDQREQQCEGLEYLPIFGAYLKITDNKPNQSPRKIFGEDIYDMATRPMRDIHSAPVSLRNIGLGIAGASAILVGTNSKTARIPTRVLPIIGTIAFGSAVWPHLRSFFRHRQTRLEASPAALLEHASSLTQKRRVLALEEFRERLAAGEFETAERQPDGKMRKLSTHELRAIASDLGRNLIICSEPEKREMVRSYVRPVGDLYVKVGDAKAASMFCSTTLINEADEEVFSQRVAWLGEQAREAGLDTHGFSGCLELIAGLRHPKVRKLAIESKPVKLSKLEYEVKGTSVISKLQSGQYTPFETVLHKLPLKDLPRLQMKRREK